jgi:hypothetical protein
MDDATKAGGDRSIGWLHAIVATAIILVVGIGLLVYGTNAVLTRAHRLTRSGQVAIVAPAFFVILIALGWVLRRLQQRKVI